MSDSENVSHNTSYDSNRVSFIDEQIEIDDRRSQLIPSESLARKQQACILVHQVSQALLEKRALKQRAFQMIKLTSLQIQTKELKQTVSNSGQTLPEHFSLSNLNLEDSLQQQLQNCINATKGDLQFKLKQILN